MTKILTKYKQCNNLLKAKRNQNRHDHSLMKRSIVNRVLQCSVKITSDPHFNSACPTKIMLVSSLTRFPDHSFVPRPDHSLLRSLTRLLARSSSRSCAPPLAPSLGMFVTNINAPRWPLMVRLLGTTCSLARSPAPHRLLARSAAPHCSSYKSFISCRSAIWEGTWYIWTI